MMFLYLVSAVYHTLTTLPYSHTHMMFRLKAVLVKFLFLLFSFCDVEIAKTYVLYKQLIVAFTIQSGEI